MMNEYDTTESPGRSDFLIDLEPQQIVRVVALGAAVGAVVWFITTFINRVILIPLLCGDPSSLSCAASISIAGNIATVFAAVAGLLGLVRLSVFRPLLIVIAAAITLWGLSTWTAGAPWVVALLLSIVLYGVTYAAFAWLVRPRPFVAAILLTVVVVILARVLPLL